MAAKGGEGPNLEALRKYAIVEDRELTPFFAGRKGVIGRVEDACARALEDCIGGKGAKGRTWLIQGAPGAGKTSLLDYLAERWRSAGGKTAIAVRVDLECLADLPVLTEQIASVAGIGDHFRVAETESMQVGTSILGIARADGSRSTATAPLRANLDNLAAIKPPKGWKRPICVMIDEIQSVRRKHQIGLRTLHLAEHGLPIVPILAGLGNSQDVLDGDEIELSRLSSECVVDLGRMDFLEAQESVRKFFIECGVVCNEENVEAWAEEIADLSDCWPQFLRSGIAALSGELARSGGMLAEICRKAVIDRAVLLRERAYRRRRSPGMAKSKELVAKLMRSAEASGLDWDEAVDIIRELDSGPDGPARRSLPEGKTAEAFLSELIRKGALQRSDRMNERLVCPIPSFRDFLRREGNPILVFDCATPEGASIATDACNRKFEAEGGRAADLRFLAECDEFGRRVVAVGRHASEVDVKCWAEFADAAIQRQGRKI